MGIIRRSIESKKNKKQDVEEFRRLLLKRAFVFERRTKSELQAYNDAPHRDRVKEITTEEEENGEEEKLVCVTSGVTFLGLAIVNRLLSRGYSVRIAVDNEEDMEKLREMEMFREETNVGVSAVMVKVTDIESLSQAFSGCRGVFHTSAFVDPAGVSGYTKYMAELEVKASENVMEACARTESVRKCVFTSSLLACVWRDNALHDLPPVIDHNCWSEESICRDKKLWFALGKTMAERAAWRMAEDSEVKLATICPGLLTGPDSFPRNSMSSFAYLKGAQEMYADGLLATADVSRVADAHLCVYEALTNTACGRYICFNRVIQTEEEAVELAREMGMPFQRISRNRLHDEHDSPAQFKLCNQKLVKLMSRQSRCSNC